MEKGKASPFIEQFVYEDTFRDGNVKVEEGCMDTRLFHFQFQFIRIYILINATKFPTIIQSTQIIDKTFGGMKMASFYLVSSDQLSYVAIFVCI